MYYIQPINHNKEVKKCQLGNTIYRYTQPFQSLDLAKCNVHRVIDFMTFNIFNRPFHPVQ